MDTYPLKAHTTPSRFHVVFYNSHSTKVNFDHLPYNLVKAGLELKRTEATEPTGAHEEGEFATA